MVEAKERVIIYSRTKNEPIELQDGVPIAIEEPDASKDSITHYVLGLRGIDSIAHNFILDKANRVPTNVLRELVLIDNIEADANTKMKILTFRLWSDEGNYDLVRKYLPEKIFDLDDLQAAMPGRKHKDEFIHLKRLEDMVDKVIKDEGFLGKTYHLLHEASDIADDFLPFGSGLSYIRRYELLTKIIINNLREVDINAFSDEEYVEFKRRLNLEYLDQVKGIENRVRNELNRERAKYIGLNNEASRNAERYAKKKALIDEAEEFLTERIQFYPEGKTNILELSVETDIPIEILERALKTRFTHERRAEIILRQLYESNLDGLHSIRALAMEYKIKRNCFFIAKKRLKEEGIHIRKNQRVYLIREALRSEIIRAGGLNKSLSQFAQDNGFPNKGVFAALKSLKDEEPELFI